MREKNKIPLAIFISLILLIIVTVILMGIAKSPPYARQIVLLNDIKGCIWYGFKEYAIFIKPDAEKEEIVLPKSLTDYTPVVFYHDLKELENLTKECDLVYNPKGYENKTWIVIYNGHDLNTWLGGNLTLWSNKEIKRKRGIIKELKEYDGLKYYSISD